MPHLMTSCLVLLERIYIFTPLVYMINVLRLFVSFTVCNSVWTDLSHEVIASGFEDGFDNFSLSDIGAWCTKDTTVHDPWLEINFVSAIRVYGFGYGTSSNTSIMSYSKVVRADTRLDDNWHLVKVNTHYVSFIFTYFRLIKGLLSKLVDPLEIQSCKKTSGTRVLAEENFPVFVKG